MPRRLHAFAVTLSNFEIWAVAGGVAASVAFARLAPMVLGIASFFWLVRWLAYGRLTIRTPGDWSIVLLALAIPATLWTTALPEVTRPQIYRLLAGIALYYAVANWTSTASRLRSMATGLVAAGVALALSAPVSVAWFTEVKPLFIPEAAYRGLPLLLSDPIHPNIMAGQLALLLPYAVALPLFAWPSLNPGERALTVNGLLLMAAVLVLTKSRGGFMGVGAALLLLVVLRWRHGWLVLPAAILAGGLAVWLIGPGAAMGALSATQSLHGLDGRTEVWSRALYMIQDFPFTGIGMGTFRQVANAMYPFFLAGPDADIPHAHNLFLQVAVDVGLPGLVAWASLLLVVVAVTWQTYRRGRRAGDGWLAGLGAGLLASQVALVVHGLVDAVTWGTRPAVLLWAVWGLAVAGRNIRPSRARSARGWY